MNGELEKYLRNLSGCSKYDDLVGFEAWGKRLDLVEFDEGQIAEFLIELKSQIDETYFEALANIINPKSQSHFDTEISVLMERFEAEKQARNNVENGFDRLALNVYLNQNAHRISSEDEEALTALRFRKAQARKLALLDSLAKSLSSGQKHKKKENRPNTRRWQIQTETSNRSKTQNQTRGRHSEEDRSASLTDALIHECGTKDFDISEIAALVSITSTRDAHMLIADISSGKEIGSDQVGKLVTAKATNTMLRYSEEACRLRIRERCRTVFENLNDGTVLPVFYLWDYWSERSRIIDFKNNVDSEVENAGMFFGHLIRQTASVVCVPPHRPDSVSDAFASVFKKLAGSHPNADIEAVRRVRAVPKKAGSKGMDARNYERELGSLEVQPDYKIEGKRVVILDDVSTSGTSLKAASMKLKEAGATGVAAVVLGKTNKKSN